MKREMCGDVPELDVSCDFLFLSPFLFHRATHYCDESHFGTTTCSDIEWTPSCARILMNFSTVHERSRERHLIVSSCCYFGSSLLSFRIKMTDELLIFSADVIVTKCELDSTLWQLI